MKQAKKTLMGKNGPTLSRLAVGAWKWGKGDKDLSISAIETLVKTSIELGVTTIDHADIYGQFENEALMGKVLANDPSLRNQIELVSKTGITMVSPNRPANKVPSYDTSKAYIIQQAEQSLKNMHTDYLDLLLIHRPSPLMQPDEMAEAFTELQKTGKVRFFGVSNFTTSQFNMLHSRFPLVTNQVEVSLLQTDTLFDGTLDQCLEYGITPMAWSPLGGGKAFSQQPNETVERIKAVYQSVHEKLENIGLDQLMLAWLLYHPANILPVLGTTKPERVKASVEAMEMKLDRQTWFALLNAARGFDVP